MAASENTGGEERDDDPFEEQGRQHDERPEGGALGLSCLLFALVVAIVGVVLSLGGVPPAYVPRLPLSLQRAILDMLMSTHVEQLSVAQPDALKEVLFGGEPWLVHCSRTGIVLPAYMKSPRYLGNIPDLRFGLLDCEEPLPSGKSTRERFKLGSSAIFTTANGNGPRPLPAAALNSAYALAAYVRTAVALPIVEVTTDEQLAAGCLIRPCLLLAERAVSGDTARNISAAHRKLRVMTVPASHELKHQSGALALALVRVPESAAGGAAASEEDSAEEAGKDSAPTHSSRWLERVYEGDVGDVHALSAFAASIPARAGDSALNWFAEAERPPKIASRRGRGQQRADEASRRAQMAREEEEYAKSLFAADEEDGEEDSEAGAEAEVEHVDADGESSESD